MSGAPKALLLPALGERLGAVFDLVPESEIAAEVGADHGILSAHLLQEGICASMAVSDVSAASLEKARRLLALHGLTQRATFHVADGLSALPEGVSAIIIAGIGAGTIERILTQGLSRIGDAALILQPSIDPVSLRRFLMDNGFMLDAERLVRERGRYYVLMRAVRGKARYSEEELEAGPLLLSERAALLPAYLQWRRDRAAHRRK